MIIKQAEFVLSIKDKEKILRDGVPEIAMIGRSNVGKSSFINLITGNSKLAKTSKDPGRTRLVNYFSCNNKSFYLVDLPGYGYAKVSQSEKGKWAEMIEGYLENSTDIKRVFLLLDIRHDPSQDDIMMINYLYSKMLPFNVILTKQDKLSRSAANQQRTKIAQKLCLGQDNILICSSLQKKGLEEISALIEDIISKNDEENTD